MKEIVLRLSLPLAILIAAILFAYHPGKPAEKHFELRTVSDTPIVFDTETGRIYALRTNSTFIIRDPVLETQWEVNKHHIQPIK